MKKIEEVKEEDEQPNLVARNSQIDDKGPRASRTTAQLPPEPALLSDSFMDDSDKKSKYRYVFFSPCVEVFDRIHLIFQSNPDLCQNIRMAEKVRADIRNTRMQKDQR